MLQNLTITPAQKSEWEKIVTLINSAYRGEGSKKGWTTEADLLKGALRIDLPTLQSTLDQPGAEMLVCHNALKELLGCVYLQKQDEEMYLGMLTVSPDAQDQGIGKKLLTNAEVYAKKMQCTVIMMTVISVRYELIAWYQRQGYVLTSEMKPFLVDPQFGMPTQPLEFCVLRKFLTFL